MLRAAFPGAAYVSPIRADAGQISIARLLPCAARPTRNAKLPNSQPPRPLTYRDAGVDIDAGDELVERIKPFAKRTLREGVLAGSGGFGAMFEISRNYREPVIVSGTDGVGTKLKLAFELKRHDTIGIDLVAMSVNDILTSGAEPLPRANTISPALRWGSSKRARSSTAR